MTATAEVTYVTGQKSAAWLGLEHGPGHCPAELPLLVIKFKQRQSVSPYKTTKMFLPRINDQPPVELTSFTIKNGRKCQHRTIVLNISCSTNFPRQTNSLTELK